MTLERDAVECTASINGRLLELHQRLCQPLLGLPAVHAVKEVSQVPLVCEGDLFLIISVDLRR